MRFGLDDISEMLQNLPHFWNMKILERYLCIFKVLCHFKIRLRITTTSQNTISDTYPESDKESVGPPYTHKKNPYEITL